MKIKTIHLWCPNMFEFKGGIQAYSRFLLRAFAKTYPNVRVSVFLKHDKGEAKYDFKSPFIDVTYCGHYPARVRTLIFAWKLLIGAIRRRPDLIISTHVNFSPLQLILKKLLKIPYWTVAHGIDAWNIKNPSKRAALRDADRVLAVSQYTRKRLIDENSLEAEKVVILPNTFDEDRFQIKGKNSTLMSQLNINPNDKILLTVCRFDSDEKYKGYDRILSVLAKLRKDLPHLRYLLVGKGSDLERVESIVRSLDLSDTVRFAGEVSDHELPSYFNLCDLFVMPSKGEGFGIVFLEALASGKPCIAGNSDGAADPLQDGTLGILLDPDDEIALSSSIASVLGKNHTNQLLFRPSELRERTVEKFGFEAFCSNLRSIVENR